MAAPAAMLVDGGRCCPVVDGGRCRWRPWWWWPTDQGHVAGIKDMRVIHPLIATVVAFMAVHTD